MYLIEKTMPSGERRIVQIGTPTEDAAERIAARYTMAERGSALYIIKKY